MCVTAAVCCLDTNAFLYSPLDSILQNFLFSCEDVIGEKLLFHMLKAQAGDGVGALFAVGDCIRRELREIGELFAYFDGNGVSPVERLKS